MTDNEKAATFIGWEWADEYGNVAPDMSDPRNYMKAFFAVARDKSYEITFCIDRDGALVLITDFSEKVLSANGDDWGEAAVKALAALYDAEHGNE